MNNVVLIGRLTKDPDVKTTKVKRDKRTENLTIANFTIAVDRMGSDDADFIRCVAMGKQGDFVESYLNKGMKVAVNGRIQTGSYENSDGNKVYTTDVYCNNIEFCEKKKD